MLKANADHILVVIAHKPRVSAGGLFLPDSTTTAGKVVGQNKSNTQEAIVVSVGPDVTLDIKPNDRVLYEQFAGTMLDADGEELLVLSPEHLMAKLDA